MSSLSEILAALPQQAMDWRDRGGLAKIMAMQPFDEQMLAAQQSQEPLIAQGRYGAAALTGMDNPALYAFGPSSIRAFHGSPHDFAKFDASKIGTGEGAQAYGHGLYFASNEGVARNYRDSLGSLGAMDALDHFLRSNRGINLKPEEISAKLQGTRAAPLADDPQSVEAIRKLLPNYLPNMSVSGGDLTHYRYLDDAAQRLIPGRMYEVQINAEPEHFLDWDKSLNGQVAGAALEKAGLVAKPQPPSWTELPTGGAQLTSSQGQRWAELRPNAPGFDMYHAIGPGGFGYRGYAPTLEIGQRSIQVPQEWWDKTPKTGMDLYRTLSSRLDEGYKPDEIALTAKMNDAGVPGIRYLDQGSRSAGEGTHNYVVFDPSIVDIVRKYGLAGIMAGSPAFAGGGEQ